MGLHTPLCDLLDIQHPVLLAGMGGVSYAPLAAAVSPEAGNAEEKAGEKERPRVTPRVPVSGVKPARPVMPSVPRVEMRKAVPRRREE